MSRRRNRKKYQSISYRAWQLPKRGSTLSEIEDKIVPVSAEVPKIVNFKHTKRFVLCDGATGSIDEGEFAEILAQACNRFGKRLFKKLPILVDTWKTHALVQARMNFKDDSCYLKDIEYSINSTGAASTLNYLELHPRNKTYFSGAVGDTLLFHIRGNKILSKNPKLEVDEFNNHPCLIRTISPYYKRFEEIHGRYKIGDLFVMATDALSAYILDSENPLGCIGKLIHNDLKEIMASLNSAAENGDINEDDWSLVAVEIIK